MWLFFELQAWYFIIQEIYVDFYHFDFDRFDPRFWVLNGNMIITKESIKRCIMWCLKIFFYKVYMMDVEVWQVIDGPFIFFGRSLKIIK